MWQALTIECIMEFLPKSAISWQPSNQRDLIVVFTDAYDQTQELALLRPVRHHLVNHGVGIVFLSNADLRRMTADGQYALVPLLERMFKHTHIRSLILSRYTGPYWAQILRFSQRNSIPSVVFLDDNLLEVPDEMGIAKELYGHPDRRNALISTVAEVDLVIASTRTLREQLRKFGHRRLTHTPIYCAVLDAELAQRKPVSSYVKIGYMASRWHKHDLDFVAESISTVMRRFSNVVFEVFGFDWSDARFERMADRIRIHRPVTGSYAVFRRKLNTLGWDVGIAPLRPIAYNMCKANTKWVEYASAMVPVVAAKAAPYEGLGDNAVRLSEEHEWVESLSDLVRSIELRDEMISAAREEIDARFRIEHQAKQFLDMFCELKEVAG